MLQKAPSACKLSSPQQLPCQCRLRYCRTQRAISQKPGSRRQLLGSSLASQGKPRCCVPTCAAAAVEAGPDLDLAKMEPLGDRILVKPEEESTTTEGGLIMASKTTSPAMGIQDAVIGQVVAVGSEVDIAVKKGDKVLYTKYSTSDISVPDGDVTFVAQKSILATLS